VVVYGAHGVGHIVARERRMVLGAVQEVLVLELAEGLSVTLPAGRARELLRPLLSEGDLRRVQETLREDHASAKMAGSNEGRTRRRRWQAAIRWD
jgi:RNA polymerase-interacting CarD/CdnL/TRCF family regulator